MELFYKLSKKNNSNAGKNDREGETSSSVQKTSQHPVNNDAKGPKRRRLTIGSKACNVHDDTIPVNEVSDENSSNSSFAISEADELLDDVEVASITSRNDSDEEFDPEKDADTLENIITEEYLEVETSPHLPAIDVKLARIITKWLRTLPSREKVKELFKECMLPCNVDGLKPVKINNLVYEKLKLNHKVNDQRLRGINSFLTRGLGPLISIWDKILKWEAKLRDKDVSIKSTSGIMEIDGLSLDVSQIRKQFDRSIKLLCAGNCVVLDKRRQQPRSFFDPKFHYLLKASNPFTDELLGDDIDVKVAESVKSSEAANKLQFMSRPRNKPFRGNNYRRFSQGRSRRTFGQDRKRQFQNNTNRQSGSHFNTPSPRQYNNQNGRIGRSRGQRSRGRANWTRYNRTR